MDLKSVKTCDLVEELKNREAVEDIWAEPYVQKNIFVEGPAVILVITD